MSQMKGLLLQAPDGQIDESLIPLIEKWSDDEPKAIEVLETLDHAVRYSSGSSFVVMVLEEVLKRTIANECTTYEEVVKNATWREE